MGNPRKQRSKKTKLSKMTKKKASGKGKLEVVVTRIKGKVIPGPDGKPVFKLQPGQVVPPGIGKRRKR